MAEHHASVTVNAPVHQVYSMFTHFNDFPKFMSFVKEVTYYDDQRSHWVAEVVGQHQWDAVNENWIEDQQIGWRSTSGLENSGRVTFQPTGSNQTLVDVYINYNPPAGVLGDIGENLGAGARFDSVLQNDLNNFARMVDQAPPGVLDPESSNYLFHSGSAAAKGTTTSRQDETMGGGSSSSYAMPDNTTMGTGYGTNVDNTTGTAYGTSSDATMDRPILDKDIIGEVDQSTTTSDVTVEDRGPQTYRTTSAERVMPSMEPGVRSPVLPQGEQDTTPMPGTTGVQNPVINQEGTGSRSPVMPPDDDVNRNPVMPPDRDREAGY